jgi:general stress protein YciG
MVDRNKNQDNTDLSDAARKMRTASSAEERSQAASQLGREGGKQSHGGHGGSEKRNAGTDSGSDLSDAARRMRTAESPEERSRAASEMGREGGKHSHDRDND